MQEDVNDIEVVIEKATLADRIQRDEAARLRRKQVKLAKTLHTFKEEKEARERLQAKRRMEKLHRQKMKKLKNSA